MSTLIFVNHICKSHIMICYILSYGIYVSFARYSSTLLLRSSYGGCRSQQACRTKKISNSSLFALDMAPKRPGGGYSDIHVWYSELLTPQPKMGSRASCLASQAEGEETKVMLESELGSGKVARPLLFYKRKPIDLIRALVDLGQAGIAPEPFGLVGVQVAVVAHDLHGLVADLEGGVRGYDLGSSRGRL